MSVFVSSTSTLEWRAISLQENMAVADDEDDTLKNEKSDASKQIVFSSKDIPTKMCIFQLDVHSQTHTHSGSHSSLDYWLRVREKNADALSAHTPLAPQAPKMRKPIFLCVAAPSQAAARWCAISCNFFCRHIHTQN